MGPNPHLYTVGYQQRTVGDLITELLNAGVDLLVDVRETPWSHRRDYSKRRLSASLEADGIDYVHARFAGNPKELRRSAASHRECLDLYGEHVRANPEITAELDLLLREGLQCGRRICLFCYERHPDDCHRSLLIEQWISMTALSVTVVHLGAEGAPRFLKE